MKYQRVLYTHKLTPELKSKLHIASYDKRRSSKGNVYYVSFASHADVEYADRTCKRLRNITLKPFQPHHYRPGEYKGRINIRSNQETTASSLIPFHSPPSMLTFLPASNSALTTFQSDSVRRINETLEERVMCVLGPCIESNRDVTSLAAFQPLNPIISTPVVNLIGSHVTSNTKDKQQLIDNIQSCLKAMKTARRAADDLCQLYRRGINRNGNATLNHLFRAHSTAFYLKATTSAQIQDLLLAGLRLSWPDLANNINDFRIDVGHEQLFIEQIASAKHISSKIDSATSIAMSSKLAYQLTKLSH